MRSRALVRFLLVCMLLSLAAGCSRDPNVRKQKYLESGIRYMDKDKYREAAIQFANALQIDPKFNEAHYQMSRAYIRLNRMNDAYRELKLTCDQNPQHIRAQVDLANLLLAAQSYDEAEKHAKAALSVNGNSVEAHRALANIYMASGKPDQAFAEMKTALDLDPKNSQTYLNLGVLHAAKGDAAQAEASVKRAIELDSKNVDAVLMLAGFYQAERRWSEAEAQYRRAIEINSQKVSIRVALARLYVLQNRMDLAEQVFIEAKKALPDDPAAYNLLGEFYMVKGDSERALAEFDSLYREHSKDIKTRNNYIQALLSRDRWDDARKLTDEILEKNAKDTDALVFRGRILLHDQKPKEALGSLQEALKRAQDNAQAHYYLGIAQNLTGNALQAETEWRDAVRLDPTMMQAHEALASVASQKKDYSALLQTAEQIIRLSPNSPAGYWLRAGAEFNLRQLPKAEADLKKASELAPDDPRSYLKLAAFRVTQKNYAEAEKLYEAALQRSPNMVDALRGLAEIYGMQKTPDRALARVDAQITKQPDAGGLYLFKGILLMQKRDFRGAEAPLTKAVELSRNQNVEAMILLAQVLAANGSMDRAAATYEMANRANADDPRPYLLHGMLEDSRGNWQFAQKLYQTALQKHADPIAANNLACSLVDHGGSLDQALSLAQTARQALPDAPATADTLAWVYYHKGLYRMAIDLLEEAVKQDKANAAYQYHLGMAYEKTGDKTRAKAHLQKALQANPSFAQAPDAKRALSEL